MHPSNDVKPLIKVCELYSLEQGLFGSERFLLGEKGSEVSSGAGVGELGRGFGCTARVLHVQVVHQEQLRGNTHTS